MRAFSHPFRRPVAFLLTCALCVSAAAAQPADTLDARITGFETGVVCNPVVVDLAPAPDTVSGSVNVVTDLPGFTADSRRVPAVIGISFGAVIGPNLADFPYVEMVVTHPPMGPNGVTEQRYPTSFLSGDRSPAIYMLEREDELVIGTWTFEARAEGAVLFRSTFEVVPPQALPELARICDYENLLS